MANSFWLYRIFDVAEEINLERVEQILAQTGSTSRMKLSRVRSKSIQIKNPPVTIELGEETVTALQMPFKATFSARIFDLGVISIVLRITLPLEFDYDNIHKLSVYMYNTDDMEPLFENKLSQIQRTLQDAMFKPVLSGFVEDYIIYFFRNWNPEWDPAPLLLAETEPLSDQVRRELTANSFVYGREDLAVITWDSALVYDASGSADIPDLLEFANSQLLELRYYDNLLSDEMRKMYQAIEDVGTVPKYGRRRQYRKIMNELMELVADVSEITERIHNSLKVTEDIFYARVYGSALNIFRTRAWADSIERKISIIQQSYSMLSDEIVTQQSAIMELAIVLLIMLEIVLGLNKLL
ncbi:hypothetical protein DCCM_4633 [Desulfocucumis palustris]|uniref:DUF155 domain-containing protein n=1 Tax=Desulfocucumis palustris TaxID=1898651 RepID=A0A2L2XHP0_9FIRM|nr:hypothetical protein [Desulfocucumis palustris]GBF35504.1 hypothetical protein DCCM_4633 [Desulfocucumis palustris]